jgi:hypothetical protein
MFSESKYCVLNYELFSFQLVCKFRDFESLYWDFLTLQ